MRHWLRRLAYLSAILLWLLVMSFPALAFVLATRGEIQVGGNGRSYLRVFLVQEPTADGVGIEWRRPARRQPHCAQTTVNYMMWEGEGERAVFCQCYDPLTGEPLPALLAPCR